MDTRALAPWKVILNLGVIWKAYSGPKYLRCAQSGRDKRDNLGPK